MSWNEKRTYTIQKYLQQLSNNPQLSKEERDFLAKQAIDIERNQEFNKALIERKMDVADHYLEKGWADLGIRKNMTEQEINEQFRKQPMTGWAEIKAKLNEHDKEKIDIILDTIDREREIITTYFFTEIKKQKRPLYRKIKNALGIE